MRPLMPSGASLNVQAANGDAIGLGDCVAYRMNQCGMQNAECGSHDSAIGSQIFVHRVWWKTIQGFWVNDDAATTALHFVPRANVIGKARNRFFVSRFSRFASGGYLGLAWGLLCHGAYRTRRSLSFLALMAAFVFSPLFLHATPRIKTVEYTFGSRDGATAPVELNTNVAWTPAYITVNLPEVSGGGITVRSAWLEVYAHCEDVDMPGNKQPIVRFNAGTTATTDRTSWVRNALVTNNSGEIYTVKWLVDVTSVINAAASSQTYALSVLIQGPRTNTHSAKLYITYQFDSAASTQLRTVRFPLYSDAGNNIATKTGLATAGTHNFTFNAALGEDASATVRQYWFEINGYQQDGADANDATVQAAYASQSASITVDMTMNADAALRTNRWFNYVRLHTAALTLNASQTLGVTVSKPVYALGGELVVTYEAPLTAPTRTKTVKRFFAQGTARESASNFSPDALFFKQGGFAPKEFYAKLAGTYDGTVTGSPSVTASVAGQSVTARSYTMGLNQANSQGHYVVFHSLNERLAFLADGAQVDLDYSGVTNNGAMGVEWVITYQFTGNEDEYSSYYEIFGGMKNRADTTAALSTSFNTYFPEAASAITLEHAWLEGAFSAFAGVLDKETLTRLGTQANQNVQHTGTLESGVVGYFQDVSDQITATGASYTAVLDNGPTATNAAYSYVFKCSYNVSLNATVAADQTPLQHANNSKKCGALKIRVTNPRAAGGGNMEASEFKLRLTDGSGANLTAAQAQALFSGISLIRDHPTAGTLLTYQPDFDTTSVGSVTNAQLGNASIYSSGILTFNNILGTLNDPDTDANLQVTPQNYVDYFVVFTMAAGASAASPNTFDIRLDADGTPTGNGSAVVRDGPANTPLTLTATDPINSYAITAINPAGPFTGYPASYAAAVRTIPSISDDGAVYVALANGTVQRVVTNTGANSQIYNTGAAMYSTPYLNYVVYPPASSADVSLYFGNDAGNVYGIRGNGTLLWTNTSNASGGAVRSSPAADATYLYIGTGGNLIDKIWLTDGTEVRKQDYTRNDLGGDVTSSPALFNGTNYVGNESITGSSFFALSGADGSIQGQINVGKIVSSPFKDNNGKVYFTSTNGYLYCRNASTLATVPGWTDFNTGSSIESSPFLVRHGGSYFVYFGANNGKIYKVNAATGQEVWRYPAGAAGLGAIVTMPTPNSTIDPALLVFGSDNGGLYALGNLDQSAPTLKTGYPVFSGAEIRGGPSLDASVTPCMVFTGSHDQKLSRFDITP